MEISIPDGELYHALDVAQAAARHAGDYLMAHVGNAQAGRQKAARDAQLDVDLGAESLILDALRSAFPTDNVLSEEAGVLGAQASRTWIVDPLDGSFNFQHGSPLFGTIIALQVGGLTQVGVIYLPDAGEMYTAVRGHGAYRNGEPIRVSQVATLEESIVHMSDFATTGIADDNVRHLATMSLLADRVGRVRMIGTAAGDYAYVASGWADGLLMYSSHPWDNEAGALLVTEAGGRVERRTDAAGKAFYVAGNREIQRQLDDLVAM